MSVEETCVVMCACLRALDVAKKLLTSSRRPDQSMQLLHTDHSHPFELLCSSLQ